MRNWILILLTVLVVVLCAFLPELVMENSPPPQLSTDYPQVSISSQSSSDYLWRMERIGEHSFGEGENLLSNYISEVPPGEEVSEDFTRFMTELDRLIDLDVVPAELGELLETSADYRIRYYYIFDNTAVSGFRIAELFAASANWRILLTMDAESGKLAKLEYGGSRLIPGGTAIPRSSWYDVLSGFARYLGLSTGPITPPENDRSNQENRRYYDSNTADRWAGRMTSGDSAWLELRVIRESFVVKISVYNGG